MKKLLFTAAVAAFVTVACQKDRTCSCTTTSSLGGSATTQEVIFKDASKSQAKAGCVSTVRTYTAPAETVTQECELK